MTATIVLMTGIEISVQCREGKKKQADKPKSKARLLR